MGDGGVFGHKVIGDASKKRVSVPLIESVSRVFISGEHTVLG